MIVGFGATLRRWVNQVSACADAHQFWSAAWVTLKQVTPGCVSSGAENFDGWQRRGGTATKCWRQHSDGDTEAVTKLGSFYSLKTTSTTSAWNHAWPDATLITDANFLARFAGRTVTAGCWVYSTLSTPEIRLNIYTNSGDSYSTQTVEQNTWTWLETTVACPDALTNFQVQLNKSGATSETYYVSQVCLVLGSAIGEGNYTRPQGEIVDFEDPANALTGYNYNSFSTTASTTLNTEALSSGQIPKGAKAIYFRHTCYDSGSAASTSAGSTLSKSGYTGSLSVARVYCAGKTNDAIAEEIQRVGCDSNGDVLFQCTATGTNTMDISIIPIAVELR